MCHYRRAGESWFLGGCKHCGRPPRGQDMLDRTPAPPEPLPPDGEELPPVVIQDIKD